MHLSLLINVPYPRVASHKYIPELDREEENHTQAEAPSVFRIDENAIVM